MFNGGLPGGVLVEFEFEGGVAEDGDDVVAAPEVHVPGAGADGWGETRHVVARDLNRIKMPALRRVSIVRNAHRHNAQRVHDAIINQAFLDNRARIKVGCCLVLLIVLRIHVGSVA